MNEPRIHAIDWPDITPMRAFLHLPKALEKPAFLLSDSTQGSRYSVLTANPVEVISGGADLEQRFQALLDSRKCQIDTPLPFVGGLIGSIAFPDLEGSPEPLSFGVYDQALVYDHQDQQWYEVNRGEDRLKWKDWSFEDKQSQPQSLSLVPSWDETQYRQRFYQIKEAIRQGEIYQACLTFPFFGEAVKEPRELFAQLIAVNPAPMAAYLEQENREILSLSPERFIHWDGSRLESKPIKGTRPRGQTEAEDRQICSAMLEDEKERAELTMITDLLRNDMARVSIPGSVKVLSHHELQACPTVWHTFSQIVSKTRPDVRVWDIFEAMLPGGSISGCPKRRAVRLLSAFEEHPRGIYTGCLGYISDHGTMDLNIAIRTLEQRDGRIQAGFGGGIVYDSEASAEYRECFDKAKPFL